MVFQKDPLIYKMNHTVMEFSKFKGCESKDEIVIFYYNFIFHTLIYTKKIAKNIFI